MELESFNYKDTPNTRGKETPDILKKNTSTTTEKNTSITTEKDTITTEKDTSATTERDTITTEKDTSITTEKDTITTEKDTSTTTKKNTSITTINDGHVTIDEDTVVAMETTKFMDPPTTYQTPSSCDDNSCISKPSRNMVCFTAAYSCYACVTKSMTFYFTSQITTLEKQFNFSSTVSGLLLACNEIGFLLVTLFLSYLAPRVHRPRALALSASIFGMSCLFCSVPHWGVRDQLSRLTPSLDGNTSADPANFRSSHLCYNLTSLPNTQCQAASDELKSVFSISGSWRTATIGIIAVCMVIQGMAKSPRLSFGCTYIDDNVHKTRSAMHIGSVTGVTVFGPAIAFTLGGMVSRIYVTLEDTSLSPRDPRWLGAWWLGFLVIGGMGLATGMPLTIFPRRMQKGSTSKAVSQVHPLGQRRKLNFIDIFKDFLQALTRLLTNKVYTCVMTASILRVMSDIGMSTFVTKYLETQFNIVTSRANFLFGILSLVTSPTGAMLGGWLTSRLKLSPLSCIKLVIVTLAISVVTASFSFFLGCPQPDINKGQDINSSGLHATSDCARDCLCDANSYVPVCGSDGINYFSACYAGCLSLENGNFTNCSCVASSGTQTAVAGLCATDCSSLYPLLAVIFTLLFVTMFSMSPNLIILMRFVQEPDKPLALGLFTFISSIIAYFLGPIVFGSVVDSACLVWNKSCDAVGACSLYDLDLFRLRLHGLFVSLRLGSLLVYLAALLLASRAQKTTEKEDRSQGTKDNTPTDKI